ncbi:MAG: DUF5103 domain-containing protein [Gemmatimonadaceae bacterium]|nr:DUF5103 domain-containing protein [Chitinophagaceae bacterium]
MRLIYTLILIVSVNCMYAQVPDRIYSPSIRNVKLHYEGNQLSYPIIKLNGGDRLELHFDDLGGGVRNYSYTYVLCNADWSPAILSSFDYIRGFSQMRIRDYRNSSISIIKYTHYSAVLPDRSCAPSRSGNYLVKVFADGDPAKVLFTRRLLVMEEKATVGAVIQQPFNGQIFKTHQKIQFKVNLANNLNVLNAIQQVKAVVLQNNRWDNAVLDIKPTFIRQNALEYNRDDESVFPSGREWRWLDLRSFRLQTDRVADTKMTATGIDVFVKPDLDRSPQRLVFYRDENGMYVNEVSESVNPLWQADYANVHFSFVPAGNQPHINKDIYVFGELTNYGLDESSKMTYNAEKGIYEATILLKQGYYNYCYVSADRTNPKPSFELTEGNLWETENSYTILIYYRALGGRADELIGVSRINSLTGRN